MRSYDKVTRTLILKPLKKILYETVTRKLMEKTYEKVTKR